MLSVIEDRTLAMAEGDFVSFKTARPVLGTYFERNVSFSELSSVTGSLSAKGYLSWRIRSGGVFRYRKRASIGEQRSCRAFFTATPLGIAYLASNPAAQPAFPRDIPASAA